MSDRPSARALTAAALFLPTVVCISAANNIIFRNLLDIPYSGVITAGFALAFVGGTSVLIPFFRRAPHRRAAAGFARVCLAAGTFVLANDALAFALGGAVTRFVLIAAIDQALLLGLVLVFSRVRFAGLARVFAIIAPLLLAQGVGAHGLGVLNLRRQALARASVAASTVAAQPVVSPARAAGNVYHILFDGFQREAFPIARAQVPEVDLAAFTFYPSAISNYGVTHYSLVGTLAGRFYEADTSMVAWREEMLVGGLWGALARGSVDTTLYPYYTVHCTPLAGRCRPAQAVPRSVTGVGAAAAGGTLERAVVDIWFLSLLPRSVRIPLHRGWAHVNDPPDDGAGQTRPRFSITDVLQPRRLKRPGFIRVDDLPAFSIVNMDRAVAEEAARPPRGQYIFIHAILPHRPYVMTPDCTYTARPAVDKLGGYLDQSACALRMVGRLVDELRRLERLDDALILVQSDHGMWPDMPDEFVRRFPTAAGPVVQATTAAPAQGPVEDAAVMPRRSSHTIAWRSGALLLIKFPGAQTPLPSPRPAQAIDAAPTILTHFGLPTVGFIGAPLQDPPRAEHMPPTFFSGAPIPNSDLPIGHYFSRFTLENGRWHYAGDVPARD